MTPSFVGSFKITGKKVFIRLKNQICDSSEELLRSHLCGEIIRRAVASLERRKSVLLKVFGPKEVNEAQVQLLLRTLEFLEKMPVDLVGRVVPGSETISMEEGQALYIPPQNEHGIFNDGPEELRYMYIVAPAGR